MGLNPSPDLDEEKYIYELISKGCGDAEILRALEAKFTERDRRTVQKIRKRYEIAEEVLRQSGRIRGVKGGSAKKDVEKIIEIHTNMQKGLRPVIDEDTGEIRYESYMEI